MVSHVHKGIWEAYGRRCNPMGGHGRQSGTGSVLGVIEPSQQGLQACCNLAPCLHICTGRQCLYILAFNYIS